MRWLGMVMATVGLFAVIADLVLGTAWLVPYVVWGGVGAVGVIIVVNNPPKPRQDSWDGNGR